MSDVAIATPDAPARLGPLRWVRQYPPFFTLALIVAVCVVVGTLNPAFWQVANLFDIARASVVRGLFALGVLCVLAGGGLDVSFTAIAALTMYATARGVAAWAPGLSMVFILLLGAGGGAVLGVVNGLLVHVLRAPSLIVTIGTQYAIQGFLLTFVGTALFTGIPSAMDRFGRIALATHRNATGASASLPAAVLVLLAAAIVTWWILRRTLIGRAIYAVGGSETVAARLGFDLRSVRVFVFGYAGLLAGIAGIMHVSLDRLANPFDLGGTELGVIAAVVLGGARITGGTGTVIGTMLGTVLITLVDNVLILVGIPSTWQLVIVGAFILLAGLMFSAGGGRRPPD